MQPLIVKAPNENLELKFCLDDLQGYQRAPTYSIKYLERFLIKQSLLGLELQGMKGLISDFNLDNYTKSTCNNRWKPIYGEREFIDNHYNSLIVCLREKSEPNRTLNIEFRVYDYGVAFRYDIPEQAQLTNFVISDEKSQFHFPENCFAYAEYGAEGEYEKVLVSEVGSDCERPLTIEYPEEKYLCLTEANANNYSRTLFRTNSDNPWIIESQLSGLITNYVGYGSMAKNLKGEFVSHEVMGESPFKTPWRVMIIGEKPGDLLEHNYIILNLNEPCTLSDASWIKPGKAMRDVTISTIGGKATVDFAAEHNFKYILLDCGWYGDPFDVNSDAAKLPDKVWERIGKKEHQGLDLLELIDYAEQKGIGVFLYLDRRAVEKQIDRFLPEYKKWGVKGIKVGFANVGPQVWTKWIVDVVRKCAEYKLLVNIHDAYRPTGISRTYPNLLTQEGIRGNEHMPTARHNATLPFTRMVAGAADYTICYYINRKQTTFAHQLALSVIMYSPLQLIFWYDRPSDYKDELETEFFANVPTVWDDTKVINGQIGEYVTIARCSKNEWFLGCITNDEEREISIDLSFLSPGYRYMAAIYDDDLSLETRTKVRKRTLILEQHTSIMLKLPSCGGAAVHFTLIDKTIDC